jgi:hypothetical protein
MTRSIAILAAASALILGCVTMPDPINTAYLSEIKSDESERIQQLEKEILVHKKEKDATRAEHEIAIQEMTMGVATTEFLERKMMVFREKEKFFSLTKNEAASDRNAKAIRELEKSSSAHGSYVKYARVRRDHLKSILDQREAEMSVAIWEMQYEKAKIARNYQERRPEEFSGKKSGIARYFQGKKKIDPTEYEKFMLKQRDIAKKARENAQKIGQEKAVLEPYRNLKYEVD